MMMSPVRMAGNFAPAPKVRFGLNVGEPLSYKTNNNRTHNGTVVGVVNYRNEDGMTSPLLTQVTPAQEALLQTIADNTTGLKEAIGSLTQVLQGKRI